MQQLSERLRVLETTKFQLVQRRSTTYPTVATVEFGFAGVAGGAAPPFDTPSNGTPILVTLAIGASPYTASLDPLKFTFYFVSASAGSDFTFTLPAATGSAAVAIVKKMDANAHNIVIGPTGADTIDGVNNATLSTITLQYDALRLIDGAAGAYSIW
jgi:hypothetical protein